jgi:hypothetical protein
MNDPSGFGKELKSKDTVFAYRNKVIFNKEVVFKSSLKCNQLAALIRTIKFRFVDIQNQINNLQESQEAIVTFLKKLVNE